MHNMLYFHLFIFHNAYSRPGCMSFFLLIQEVQQTFHTINWFIFQIVNSVGSAIWLIINNTEIILSTIISIILHYHTDDGWLSLLQWQWQHIAATLLEVTHVCCSCRHCSSTFIPHNNYHCQPTANVHMHYVQTHIGIYTLHMGSLTYLLHDVTFFIKHQ